MELPLKDIHLSDPVSWWPLAFGWWILFGAIASCLCLVVLGIRKYAKPTLKKEAAKTLDNIEKMFCENGDAVQCLADLSALLRRITLKIYSSEYAGLTGNAWLQVLDKGLKEPEFSQGLGKMLIHAPYQPRIDAKETSELIQLCRKWVNNL